LDRTEKIFVVLCDLFFLVRIAEEGNKTILHRGFTESIKKHAEDNKAHRKHRHSEGDGYSLKRGK